MIEILRIIDGRETVVYTVADDNASVVGEIMGREEVSVNVTVDSPLGIRVGDFVRADGTVYTLNREASFEKRSDVEYLYDLVFESPLYRLLDKLCTHPVSGVSTFSVSRTLDEFVKIIVDCINTIDPGWTVSADIPETDPVSISFEGVSCRDALSHLSDRFDMEFYLSGKEVCFVRNLENATGLLFEQGKGKGLYTVTQEPVDTGDAVTRVYPYGGTTNMTPGTGDTNGRLFLPEGYLENLAGYGKVVEREVVFDDIFPCFKGSVDSVSGEYNRVITCEGIDFNITDWLIGGVKAKINFLSGELMGESFEFTYTHASKQINLIRKEDGMALTDSEGKRPLIPHDLKRAVAGNRFSLTDIYVPLAYKTRAIDELRARAADYLAFYSNPRVKFALDVDHRFLRGKRVLRAGDIVTVKIPETGMEKPLRVNSVERNLGTGKMSCVVSNYLDEKWEKRIEKAISEIRGTISAGGAAGGASSRIEIIGEYDSIKPTNENVYAAKRTDREIRESEERAERKFLRKDFPDTAFQDISFEKNILLTGDESSLYSRHGANDFGNMEGICLSADGTAWLKDLRVKNNSMFARSLSSPLFVSGFPEGTGWMLAPYRRMNAAGVEETRYKLEIDDLDVRGRMRIHEFVASQLLGENDNRIFAGMMEVDHYDSASGRIYLDTDGGRLYNPFRAGDICMVQQFQGKPTMENGYDVTKSYEFVVKAVGVGNLSDGEDRLDWITFEDFVGDISKIIRRDTVVRVDSVTDATRKGIIKITTIDEFGTPYLDVAYGMKTDPGNATKVRIGNLNGIVTPHFGRLDGYGGYMENLFARGKFILSDTGEDVSTSFKLLNGRLSSEMSSLRHELSERDNYLTNSSFSEDTVGWELSNDVSLYTVSQRFIAVNDGLYSDKASVAGIVEVLNRLALRIRDSSVRQRNAGLARKPDGQLELPDGTKAWPTFHVSMMVRVVTAGRLTAGFQGQGLYSSVELEPESSFKQVEFKGTWDGTGDFIIDFTGEIYIYNLLLTDRPLDNFRIEMSTRLTQTDKRIGLYANKVDNLSATVTGMGVELDNTTSRLSLYVTKTDNIAKTVTDLGIKLDGVDGSLSLYAKNTDVSSLRTELSAAIQVNAEGITQKVSITDYTGQVIASKVNQTATDYSIEASKINLKGKVTFSMFDTSTSNKIDNKADAASLGSLAYKNAVEKAMLGETVIVNGHIITDLIDTESIFARQASLGAFNIDGMRLVATSAPDSLSLSPSGIAFSSKGMFSGLGPDSAPGVFGVDMGAWIMVNKTAPANYGMALNVSGASNEYGNIALLLQRGCIAGFRMKTRRIDSHYSMEASEGFISCYNTSDIDLYLPFWPEVGDMKIIRRNNEAGVRILAVNYLIMRVGAPVSNTWMGEGDGDMAILLFDGQYWAYNYMGR